MAPRHAIITDTVIRYRSHAGSLTFAAADMRDKLSRHLLDLAATRLAEVPPASQARAAYRRWHAWAAGYRALVQLRGGALRDALATMGAAFRVQPLWPLRFAARLPEHWRGRGVRRGA